MISVLVTCGGGFQGLALVKALRALPAVRVVVTDWEGENVSRYFAAAFRRAPPIADQAEYVDFLLDCCRRDVIDAVLPATSLDQCLLARHRKAIEATGAALYICHEELLGLGADKWAAHQWLIEHDLPSLPTRLSPRDPDLRPPLIGKPRAGHGSRGQIFINDEFERDALHAEALEGCIWQPRLAAFDEYSVDFAVHAERGASPLAIRRRIRTYGGFAILCDPSSEPAIANLARKLVLQLADAGARGVLNAQIIATPDGAWVSDINTRVGTSLPLSLAAGINPLAFLLGIGSGVADSPPPWRTLRTLEEHAVAPPAAADVAGVVFDLDDTLFDQKDWILRKLDGLWDRLRDELPPRETFLDELLLIIEEGNRSHLFDAYCAKQSLTDALRRRMIEIYRRVQPESARLYPDVLPVLEQLRRSGLRIGLLTDNPASSQRMKLDVTGLWRRLDAVVFTDEHGAPKPHRQAFHLIAERLGVDAGRLAMVGDHPWRDIRGALEAGFSCAFQVRRNGALFNFSADLVARIRPQDRTTQVADLHEVLWRLPSAVRT
jgi:HAD superfamily hydrolase (TIGR01549 family)